MSMPRSPCSRSWFASIVSLISLSLMAGTAGTGPPSASASRACSASRYSPNAAGIVV